MSNAPSTQPGKHSWRLHLGKGKLHCWFFGSGKRVKSACGLVSTCAALEYPDETKIDFCKICKRITQ